ncbi:MAG: UxaA family hydrolase [Anaerolineales bacterium]
MRRRAILLDVKDDVATALVDLDEGEEVNATLDDVSVNTVLRDDIEFGHKYALRDIAEDEEVLKYGMPIGRATQDIKAGEWVHTHNCRSEHFGFHRDQYGLKA